MSDHDTATDETVVLELRLFATFRQAVGGKIIEREYPGPTVRIGDVLADLETEYGLDLLADDGTVREYTSILKNGTDIVHLDGVHTTVGSSDRISLFPPVAGG